ncbi:uncharacterized protein LOC110706739 isoform X1 [Chenopodium quinoa]|uniref:uncharacterized protein LOC110706739 isoform X1 n=1 Tax=Chenopodium quinoa TaxID=63459 RepID=UPI000B798087|nr:uncharacterized protein LOC110706739 isoform X1 [Chenopodium quinoa]
MADYSNNNESENLPKILEDNAALPVDIREEGVDVEAAVEDDVVLGEGIDLILLSSCFKSVLWVILFEFLIYLSFMEIYGFMLQIYLKKEVMLKLLLLKMMLLLEKVLI